MTTKSQDVTAARKALDGNLGPGHVEGILKSVWDAGYNTAEAFLEAKAKAARKAPAPSYEYTPSFDEWALGIASAVATRADCSRRKVGAVILDEHHNLVSAGCNRSAYPQLSCLNGDCPRASSDVEPGSSYDTGPGTCIATHAEAVALLSADYARLRYGTLYCTCEPCEGCNRLISACGISRVIWPGKGTNGNSPA